MKKLLLNVAALVLSACAAFAQSTDKPLLTIGCLSDLHNELSLINGSVDNVRLRGTITNTLNAMKEQEHIDMLILGGDYTSDCTIPEENWARVRDLIHEATKATFPIGAESFPVLYCTGNHDYEVANFDNLPKPYNAARYYDFVMKNDLGELDANECFFEEAPNGSLGTMKVLAAYHYLVNGFDFVVLNCGKHYFKNAWNYNYTDESVNWVADKLEEIYAKDPDKTVFFIAHVPFPDSNSISNSNKGQSNSTLLKKTLAKHPNVIFLYGHDHGSDNAYIRSKTSQRVTRYNADGNIISAFDDTHVDGLTQGSGSGSGSGTGTGTGTGNTEEATQGKFYVISKADGNNLGFDGNNSATIAEKNLATITVYNATDGSFYFEIGLNSSGQKHLHIGSGGRFSMGDPTPTYIYKLTSTQNGVYQAEKVTTFNTEDDYLLVGNKSGVYYAMTNTLYNAGSADQRLESVQVTISGKTLTVAENAKLLWNFAKEDGSEPEQPEQPGDGITSGTYCIQNVGDNCYLTYGTFNAETSYDPVACNITSTNGTFNITLGQTSRYLYCGTNGRFSGNTSAFPLALYAVDSKTADAITGHKVSSFELGKEYFITGDKSGVTYAVSSEVTDEGTTSQRLLSTAVTLNGETATIPADNNLLWTFSVLPEATPSFFSAFMGSMRYYNNSIEGDVSVSNSRVVQAMMIYIYSDRIVLQIKNYGQTGNLNGINLEKSPEPYTVFRTVKKDDGGTVGVTDITADEVHEGPDTIYDLLGRRVSKPDKGVYIVNGEKVAY